MALMQCPECEARISDQAEACPHCGLPLKRQPAKASSSSPTGLLSENPTPGTLTQSAPQTVKSAKSRGIYIILGLFFGLLGVHNFYAGYLGRGAVQLILVLTLGWFVVGIVVVGLWVLIEFFTVTHDAAGDKMV